MSVDQLALGLLNTSAQIEPPALSATYRDLTIAWSRYSYQGPIFESEQINPILEQAAAAGYRYCLIQPYGQILAERWHPQDGIARDWMAYLADWLSDRTFLVAGRVIDGGDRWYGLEPRCLLVDLHQYDRCGQPQFDDHAETPIALPQANPVRTGNTIQALSPVGGTEHIRPVYSGWRFIATSLQHGLEVPGLDEMLSRYTFQLDSECPQQTTGFARFLQDGIQSYHPTQVHEHLSTDQADFLGGVRQQAVHARRGVFLWNIESYDDVETAPVTFRGPVTTLYSVAAGFKPNRILQTHGFNPDTRVVFFDYSPQALRVRQHLIEHWNGDDFPSAVREVFQHFPSPDTFYQLWHNQTPDNVDWEMIDQFWQRELQRWGGAEVFREHWQKYRTLTHDYIDCDVMAQPHTILERVTAEPNAVMWWSNAFFTIYGNWFYPYAQRQEMYDRWVEHLAKRNPHLFVNGSNHNNTCVNDFQVGAYWEQYHQTQEDQLNPRKLHTYEIRM